MTERAAEMAERTATMTERRRGPDRLTVALLAIAAFLLVLAFLAYQWRQGNPRPAVTAKGRSVLARRLYETRVVETVPSSVPSGSSVTQSASSADLGSGSGAASSAPTTRTS